MLKRLQKPTAFEHTIISHLYKQNLCPPQPPQHHQQQQQKSAPILWLRLPEDYIWNSMRPAACGSWLTPQHLRSRHFHIWGHQFHPGFLKEATFRHGSFELTQVPFGTRRICCLFLLPPSGQRLLLQDLAPSEIHVSGQHSRELGWKSLICSASRFRFSTNWPESAVTMETAARDPWL